MSLRSLLRSIYHRLSPVPEVTRVRGEMQELRSDVHALTAIVLERTLENHPRYGDPRRLLKYAAQVSSQNGEDGMIHELFRRVQTTSRIFVEVGVGNGLENNTAFLLSQGWSGFWFDGGDLFLKTVENRADLKGGCLKGKTLFVTRENIASAFQELGVPAEFDLLSVDIDQNTYYIWAALESFRPRVVVVEYNSTIPADIDWKVNYAPDRIWDQSNNFGASLKAFEILGRQRGYSLVGCDYVGANAFFVRDDIVDDHFAGPFTAENHYERARFTMLHRWGHLASILDRADGH